MEGKKKYLAEERYYGEKVTAPQQPYGLPRKEIEWYPRIDYGKCDPRACEYFCVDYCHMKVYKKAGDRVVVDDPYNCNVPSQSCSPRCPKGAIIFPSKDDLKRQLRELRKRYGYAPSNT
ncbi:MAG: ferredoxin family protein [Candidatus Brockarchaeota archaeon]|nr:ferredoxin family protein [Candidatus Brockarchaeota archaeon]